MLRTRFSSGRVHLLPLLVWTVLCALFFATIMSGRERLPSGDLAGHYHAYALFQAREMAQGRLPAWSPGSYAGFPFAGDTQAAVFYPPRWLTILLSLPWGFPFLALELEAVFHVWLAGIFTYALGYATTNERVASLVGAIAFALGGYLTSYPILQLTILETIVWLPLVLLFLRLAVGRARPVPWLMVAGLLLGLSALAGHPPTFMHVSYVAAAYYLFLAVRARWSWRWTVGLGMLIALVAGGASSAALLPAWSYLPHTTRSDLSYKFVASGLPMLDYVQALVPGVLSFWSPEYFGLAGIVAVTCAILGRRRAQHGETTFWGAVALLAAWLALGDKGVLFELAYRFAPGFAMFRQQERLLGVFSFSCALLATHGVALWLHADAQTLSLLLRRAACVLGCGLLLMGLVLAIVSPATSGAWLTVWVRQLLVLAIVLALLWGGRWRRQRALLLALVLWSDLYVSTLGAVDRQPGSPAAFWPRPRWIEGLRSPTPSRIDSGGLFYAHLGEIYGLEDVQGIGPLKPLALADLGHLPLMRRWQLLNVTHVLAEAPPPDVPLTPLEEVTEGLIPGVPARATIYRFDAALPRAWMSYRPLLVEDAAAALARLGDPAFDPAVNVILQAGVEGAGSVSPPPAGHAPGVQVTRLGPGTLQITATTEAPGFLVISEWWYPGWQAELDGQRVPIYRANYALQAVRVPAGEHLVIVRFVPLLQGAGILLSCLALALAGVLAWRWRPIITQRQRAFACRTRTPPADRPPLRGMHWLWLCVALILLAFALRIFKAGSQELGGDEAFSYLFARLPLTQILPALLRQGDPHSPLHYWLLHGWMRLAGSSELSMRYASLIPGVLLLPLLLRLGRRLGGTQLGLLLVSLAAVSQSLVWIGQDLRNQYTLAIVFSTLATLLLADALERPNRLRWALYAGACALTLYSHYYGVFALLAHGFYMLAVPQWRGRLLSWGTSASIAGLAFVPWLLATWPHVTAAGQPSGPGRPELANYLVAVGTELTVGSAFKRQPGRWLFLLALALCIAGARHLFKRRPGWATLLVGWLGGATLVIFLLRFSRSTFNTFYILVASPPWWALVGAGIESLWQRRGRWLPSLAALSLAGLLLSNGLSLARYYTEPRLSRSNGYRSLAAHLAREAKPGDLFMPNAPDPCFDYYLRDIPVKRVMIPAKHGAAADSTEQALAGLAAEYRRLWFVPAPGVAWDPNGVAHHWLEYNTLLEQQTVHQNLTLSAYRPLQTVDQVLAPLDLPVAGLLRLRGAYVTIDGAPADLNASELVIPPGATIQVTLLWQALAETREGYTVFVHLLGEDNRLVAQHDGIPVFGTRPTWTWAAGEQLLDRHDFAVPANVPVGRASLLVGIYHSQTLARQRFADGRDAILLAAVRFQANFPKVAGSGRMGLTMDHKRWVASLKKEGDGQC